MTRPNALSCYMLPRVCDTLRLCYTGKLLPLCADRPAPPCFCYQAGALCGAPVLECPTVSAQGRMGLCFSATLRIPVSLCLSTDRGPVTVTGTLRLPVSAALRSPAEQFYPQLDLCIRDVTAQDGTLCVCCDVKLTLYAATLQPVQLSAPCEPCAPDCAPYFHLPLYPELPISHR